MNAIRLASLAALLVFFAPGAADAQSSLRCESRNFRYEFCNADGHVHRASLQRQTSNAACIEGQSWGWDRRGVWVSGGCSGIFNVNSSRPTPGPPSGRVFNCESRNFEYQFCPVGDRVLSASLVRQTSRTRCVMGQNWGWRRDGVWVSEGCSADFSVQTNFGPDPWPPSGNTMVCESHEYRYNFCRTGPIRNAQMVRQRSQAACVQGRSWGFQRDGVWVDNGCQATFRITTR